jgi:hypothetical protein
MTWLGSPSVLFIEHKELETSKVPVTHTCNPSYSGARARVSLYAQAGLEPQSSYLCFTEWLDDRGSKPARANSSLS